MNRFKQFVRQWLVPPGVWGASVKIKSGPKPQPVMLGPEDIALLKKNEELKDRHVGSRCFILGAGLLMSCSFTDEPAPRMKQREPTWRSFNSSFFFRSVISSRLSEGDPCFWLRLILDRRCQTPEGTSHCLTNCLNLFIVHQSIFFQIVFVEHLGW